MVYKGLVASIIKCLTQLLDEDALSADSRESLEVSIQCLESAYGVQISDAVEEFNIFHLFQNMSSQLKKSKVLDASPEIKVEAERLKNEGNTLLKNDKYHEALDKYTK